MFAPAPEKKILRRMDYISDQKGILRRYNREKAGWQAHTENAANFILEVLKGNNIDHIVVLGSGWLLDFPIEHILKFVKRISLVDVCFPSEIIRRVKDLPMVECIPADITGGYILAVYQQMKSSRQIFSIPIDIPRPKIVHENGKLILSLNILNQLDILLVDYICKSAKVDNSLIQEFRKLLQESHIRMLSEHPFILISDYREILINTAGKVLKEKDLVFAEIPDGRLAQEWEWQFDTHRLYNPDADTQMKVRAVFSEGPQKL
jgi:hypothetical protein